MLTPLRSSAMCIAALLMISVGAPIAHAQAVGASLGMPTQESVDRPSSDPRSAGPGWGDTAGGVAARPYVVSLSIINGGVSTPVVTNGTTATSPLPAGEVTTVVSPFNLCRPGQAPAQGVCYSSPNRVGLTVGYSEGETDGWDFANPGVPVTPPIDANSVIDMTVALNTLGKGLRWTWVNGQLLYWKASDLGQEDATVHIRFKPASAPYVANFPADNGCTASPPHNCEIPRADAQVLTVQLVFSLDESLDPALTGAVFATQEAIAGYLTPGASAQSPSLDVALSSTHLRADGAPELGTIEAFIPEAALLNLYGLLPSDAATALTTTRAGDPGSNDQPTYVPWSAGANGSDGLLVTVGGITFSAPKYRLTRQLKRVAVHAKVRGSRTTIRASVSGCAKRRQCVASVYRLGRRWARRFHAARTAVLKQRVIRARKLSIVMPASMLGKGDRYLLVVRSARRQKLLVSSLGRVGL
jgi:hypothetical protein